MSKTKQYWMDMEPMKYWQSKNQTIIDAAINDGRYFVMPKIDGSQYRFINFDNGYLLSRQTSVNGGFVQKQDNVPHIIEALREYPKGTVFLGEVAYPGGNSAMTTSIMGCLPKKAVERQRQNGYITYCIFDILSYGDQDLTNYTALQRQRFLDVVWKELSTYVVRVPWRENDVPAAVMQYLLEGEGAMLYKKDEPYWPGLRKAHVTIKLKKKIDTIDAIFLGQEEPTREYTGTEAATWQYKEGDELVTKAYYYGWCGAIKVGVLDEENNTVIPLGTVSSGLSDEVKEYLLETGDLALYGKPIELSAMEITADGALRHPVFLGFREDINMEDCTLQKLMLAKS